MYQSLVYELLHTSTATLDVWRSAKILTLETHNLPFDRARIAEPVMSKKSSSGAEPVDESQ